jgi:hypothetical protein
MKKIVAIMVIVSAFNAFAGDVVMLVNGKKFEGNVVKIKECQVDFKIDNIKYTIPAADIFAIKFENEESKVYKKYLNAPNRDVNKCLAGSLDAEMYHGKRFGHFMLGFLFGPAAMIGTAMSNPTPERGKETMLMSNNSDSFSDVIYLKCYKKQAKSQLVIAELLGWSSWMLIALNFLALS